MTDLACVLALSSAPRMVFVFGGAMYSIALARGLVLHFAELAGWEGDHYVVTLSRRTFDRAAKLYGAPAASDDEYGATLARPGHSPDRDPLTWINTSANKTMARMIRTCAHEALHAARPDIRHGRAYEKAVTRLTRNEEP